MRPPKLLVALSVLLALGTSDAAPPHITFFLVDDLGWNDVSCTGPSRSRRQTLTVWRPRHPAEQLPREPSMRPTRASPLSGRSVIHHGIYTPYNNGNAASGLNLVHAAAPAPEGFLRVRVPRCGQWHWASSRPPTCRPTVASIVYWFLLGRHGLLDPRAVGRRRPGQRHRLQPRARPPHRWRRLWLHTRTGCAVQHVGRLLDAMFARKAARGSKTMLRPDRTYRCSSCPSKASTVATTTLYRRPTRTYDAERISPNATCGSWSTTEEGTCTLAAMRKSVAAAVSAVDDAVGDVAAALQRAGMPRQPHRALDRQWHDHLTT